MNNENSNILSINSIKNRQNKKQQKFDKELKTVCIKCQHILDANEYYWSSIDEIKKVAKKSEKPTKSEAKLAAPGKPKAKPGANSSEVEKSTKPKVEKAKVTKKTLSQLQDSYRRRNGLAENWKACAIYFMWILKINTFLL